MYWTIHCVQRATFSHILLIYIQQNTYVFIAPVEISGIFLKIGREFGVVKGHIQLLD